MLILFAAAENIDFSFQKFCFKRSIDYLKQNLTFDYFY